MYNDSAAGFAIINYLSLFDFVYTVREYRRSYKIDNSQKDETCIDFRNDLRAALETACSIVMITDG